MADTSASKHNKQFDAEEEESVDNAAKLPSKLVYEVIRRDGEEELERPFRSLFWSGIAAGILISFSVLAEAVFRTYLPQAEWTYLVENLGYSLGFLLVIMGRMQLFTENTITTVLPVVAEPTPAMFWQLSWLWTIVLLANVVGAFAVSALYALTPAIPAELLPAMRSLSEHATGMPPLEGFARAIPAGVLVASIVWMLPQSEGNEFFVILVFTWLIAAGDFTHVVAGSVEMAFLVWEGSLGAGGAIFGFFLPVLAGNIVGGTLIFTMLAWGQVKDEVS
ncbi:MAG: formate/nitrite transporter family protein [Alphaproteobacteria bacterium]|nr:formate/nitrite transporter family protein [Alphaproteobacteria bacterium]